jgi:hypothetical protein
MHPSFRKKLRNNLVSLLLVLVFLAQSTVPPGDALERIRAFTRMKEFDFISWTFDALLLKNIQASVNAPRYMSVEDQRNVVFEYLRLVRWVNRTSAEADKIYANPDIQNPDQAAAEVNKRLRTLKGMESRLKPIAESVLQEQVSQTIQEMGLSVAGQPVPPVLYHVTRLPMALIVSPRSVIRQDQNISLLPEMSIEDITSLEEAVESDLDVSALVVPIGGVGTYPTMVMNTTDLNWLIEVISHEWTHNYLTLRPLGLLYMENEQMRTINETTANIAGKEIGRQVMLRYYPELAPPPPEPVEEQPESSSPAPAQPQEDPNVFSFQREMRITRQQADELLAEGKIKEAEDYMELRQRFFWENGYQLRRLNQAYFAFYGAYNDVPGGGAAGQDPVGPAVQDLRKYSASLVDFIHRIAWVTSYAGLVDELNHARVSAQQNNSD